MPIINHTLSLHKIPIIVGGSGFYIKALTDRAFMRNTNNNDKLTEAIRNELSNYDIEELYKILQQKDPAYAATVKPKDSYRIIKALAIIEAYGITLQEWLRLQSSSKLLPQYRFSICAIMPKREEVYKNINARLEAIISNGGIEEVKAAYNILTNNRRTSAYKTCAVPEIIEYIEQRINKDEMIAKAGQSIRRYAKRQYTWFSNQLKPHNLFQDQDRIMDHVFNLIPK